MPPPLSPFLAGSAGLATTRCAVVLPEWSDDTADPDPDPDLSLGVDVDLDTLVLGCAFDSSRAKS